MKLRNIKAHVNLGNEVDFNSLKKIFRGCDAIFTIHGHHRNVIHVTGVKSYSHLKLCTKYIENTFNVKMKEKTMAGPEHEGLLPTIKSSAINLPLQPEMLLSLTLCFSN